MTDPTLLGYTGPSPTVLRSGRTVAPGSPIDASELEEAREAVVADEENGVEAQPAVTAERDFYDEQGWLEPIEPQADETLAGDALKARAQELEIEGRASMSADELRAAVAVAETSEGGD